ncbi:MAG: Stk1 family PASTA domain-containing Ser/Thr kinase [Firmicutes bacterium]|nr:Stk1 family PASTA domain-containing Ser/Thr kinase [Bacillota bacterium]
MSSKLLLGRYEIVEKIGEGGMSVVYKAKDILLNRYVAIKILRPEFIKDEQFIENFRKESQAAAGLSHSNIVNVYDVGREGNIHFIVMELIDGKSLSQVIEEKGRLEYTEAISIAKQVASALSVAHKNQIIHRDVKPHNILITDSGVAKLADFGIARAVSKESLAEGSEKIMGSVHYFSPEQARGLYVDERSDIYSLGIVLHEMLTGKVPFDGDNPISIALMHINNPIPSVNESVKGIPPQLEKIIEKATDKYQTNRYKSAEEMISDLENIDFITKVMGSSIFAEEVEKKSSKKIEEIDVARNHEEVERKKPVNKAKLFIIVSSIIVLVAGVLGLGALMGWFGPDKNEIEVPDFKGMTLQAAIQKAEELGLAIEEGEKVYSPDQEEGKITSQSPTMGSKVTDGKVVTVNISLGKKDGVVPNIVGKDYKKAKKELEQYGFELGVVVKITSTKPENTILTQSIKAGDTADKGTVIDVEISDGKGKEMKTVPMLVGLDVDKAKTEIQNAGFKLGDILYEESTDYHKNVVTSQQYIADSELEEGSTINIVISKGPPVTVVPEDEPVINEEPNVGDGNQEESTNGDHSNEETTDAESQEGENTEENTVEE